MIGAGETAPAEAGGRSLREQAELLVRREASSRDLVQEALARIDATQSTLNAFRLICPEEAERDAAQADRRLAAGERGPVLGVPVAIKDDTDLTGYPTAFGCPGEFESKLADSESVRRVRAAGAVIVGKTNAPELGQWPITEGPAFGVTRNPWSLEHTPGGSSGGSASAVAAGLVAAALGSDGLGSIRVPAAWTHLVGIKPQRGRVSTWPYADAFHGLACNGPLARSVEDAARLLDAASGNHPADRDRPPPPVEPFADAARRADPGRRLRIAVSFKIPFAPVRRRLDPDPSPGGETGPGAGLDGPRGGAGRARVRGRWPGSTPAGDRRPRALDRGCPRSRRARSPDSGGGPHGASAHPSDRAGGARIGTSRPPARWVRSSAATTS